MNAFATRRTQRPQPRGLRHLPLAATASRGLDWKTRGRHRAVRRRHDRLRHALHLRPPHRPRQSAALQLRHRRRRQEVQPRRVRLRQRRRRHRRPRTAQKSRARLRPLPPHRAGPARSISTSRSSRSTRTPIRCPSTNAPSPSATPSTTCPHSRHASSSKATSQDDEPLAPPQPSTTTQRIPTTVSFRAQRRKPACRGATIRPAPHSPGSSPKTLRRRQKLPAPPRPHRRRQAHPADHRLAQRPHGRARAAAQQHPRALALASRPVRQPAPHGQPPGVRPARLHARPPARLHHEGRRRQGRRRTPDTRLRAHDEVPRLPALLERPRRHRAQRTRPAHRRPTTATSNSKNFEVITAKGQPVTSYTASRSRRAPSWCAKSPARKTRSAS